MFVIYTDKRDLGRRRSTRRRRSGEYREQTGIAARLVVVGMVSNGFTIADPDDAGMLDVVGFDTATPQLIADFARGASERGALGAHRTKEPPMLTTCTAGR